MIAFTGYFDGTTCVPLEKTDIKTNQKVIITVLDEFVYVEAHENKKNCIAFEWEGSLKNVELSAVEFQDKDNLDQA